MSGRRSSPFAEHVAELLEPLGGIQLRRMFGGYGIFKDGVMFALIADDTLYFRTDAASRSAFEARDLEPFVYDKAGRATSMPYHRAPDEGFDDPDVMRDWARDAFAAAVRGRRPKKAGGRTGRG